MKKITFILALALLTSISMMGQITITKYADQLKFTGLPSGSGLIATGNRFNQIYSSSVDQIMVRGDVVIFGNSASKGVIAEVPFSKISNKQGQTTAQTYVEKIVSMGYLDKSPNKYIVETLWDGINLTQGTHYFPDTVGISMDGYKNLVISGYFTEGNAVNDSIMVQVSNDYGLNYNTIYGYNWKTNTTVNQIKQTGAGTNYVAWSFPNLNFQYVRIIAGFSDATNIVNLDARKSN